MGLGFRIFWEKDLKGFFFFFFFFFSGLESFILDEKRKGTKINSVLIVL
jgi:hypothetical protein